MSTTPWEDFAKRSRELYEQQAELTKTWFAGQTKLSGPLPRPAKVTPRPASAPMRRQWPSCGVPGWGSATL